VLVVESAAATEPLTVEMKLGFEMVTGLCVEMVSPIR